MSRFGDNSDGLDESDIDISPLIDCVFILLIFFIVTTVFVKEPGQEVTKPYAVSAEELDRNANIIAINAEGDVFFGGRNIGVSGLQPIVKREVLKSEKQDKNAPTFTIRGDNKAPARVTYKVIQEIRSAGATTHISTELPQ